MTLQEYVDSLKGRRIAVLGIGVSNTPLIDLLLKNELPLTVCDMRSEEALGDTAAQLRARGASSASARVIWTTSKALTTSSAHRACCP